MENIYEQIARRTGGNIYVGVVGPVRTGKSTLIKRIMEELVIPRIDEPYRRERAKDELPQSGSGRTIMTSEPKFVPEEAVEISPDGTVKLRIRMIDSVGYMIPGAVGVTEEGVPRMVTTPWFDYEIPMTQAAELGTKKVMQEHCSIGLVVTTDATVTDIPRQDYLDAESRAIRDMQQTGKPFLVVINSRSPHGPAAAETASYIRENFGLEPFVADCQTLDEGAICRLLEQLLYAFPMESLRIYMPRWMDALEAGHPARQLLQEVLLQQARQIRTLGEASDALAPLGQLETVSEWFVRSIDPGTGNIDVQIRFPRQLFFDILSAKAGAQIHSDAQLLALLEHLRQIKEEYDKVSDALCAVQATGYGIVMPGAGDVSVSTPELVHKNGAYGVRLKASAPSIHMVRVDIDTQIQPMVGSEQQSMDLIAYLGDGDAQKLWESNIFGKSVYELLQEGLTSKVQQLPEEVRAKFRGTLCKIVNDGATGLICLIL